MTSRLDIRLSLQYQFHGLELKAPCAKMPSLCAVVQSLLAYDLVSLGRLCAVSPEIGMLLSCLWFIDAEM